MMGEEANFFVKYAPYYVPIVAAILLIIFTKKYLFSGMVSLDMHQKQIEREARIVLVQETFSNRLEEYGRQQEGLIQRVHEEVRGNSDRLRTLEMVFSDNIDAIRELTNNCEKHRKNIPDTENFTQRGKKP